MLIYKILRSAEWDFLRKNGETAGAPVDVADGYVHFSTAAQLQGTFDKHFARETGLYLLACESQLLEPDLRWEPSRGGADFPHLYRALRMTDIVWSRPLKLSPEGQLSTDPGT